MTDQLSLRFEPGLPRLPTDLRPMLAQTATEPFDSAKHLFEPSWGGERALAFIEIGRRRPVPARRRGAAATWPPSCPSWPTCRPGSSPGPP